MSSPHLPTISTSAELAEQLAHLVYWLIDAHADTDRLMRGPSMEFRWQAHLHYLLDLQRTGREIFARCWARCATPTPTATAPASAASLVTLVEHTAGAAPEPSFNATEIMQAVASAPAVYRDAVIAVDILGMSYREAARALRARQATITTRLHRGRQHVALALIP